ncbi:P1 family peptidase [Streptomyces kunmingensis]|uniref:P1 family peptidase n=1 Tax=Streptomyces kunmingensis TaxID=68225 RepID=A0ABU6CG59_9ACTN|nr:P1 family peptidase [Streptomyces kunmingensis]MEB3963700.1 P1 family peptidase [Streptomyces kunmingensis]
MTTTHHDALTDVAGVRVGHATRTDDGHLTGTTVVLAPEGGAVTAVDVRGGGPGTRETDALDPRNLVQRIEAIVLTGGSAYGLDSASGVMAWLEEHGRGVPVGGPGHVVPVVPAACVFDLGRGGDWRARPDAATGRAAVAAAAATQPCSPVREGNVGAGTGALVGRLRGGIGTASAVLGSGITVSVLVVANAAGSALDPATGALYGEFFEGRGPVTYPSPASHEAAAKRIADAEATNGPAPLSEPARPSPAPPQPPLNTTLAVVATDADLSRAQAQKVAGTAHDGIARAVRPVHLLNDGDTVFALATGARPLDATDPLALNEILAAGADLVTRAIVRAVRAAESVHGPGGTYLSYSDLYGPRQTTPRRMTATRDGHS